MSADHEPSVQLALVHEQISNLDRRFAGFEHKLDELGNLEKVMAELAVHHENDKRERQAMWSRIEELMKWNAGHDQRDMESYLRVADSLKQNSEKFSSSCTSIEQKVDSWINKGKGAMWIAGIFLTFVQGLFTAAIFWAFTSITTLQDRVLVLETEKKHVMHQSTTAPPQVPTNYVQAPAQAVLPREEEDA